MSKTPREPKSAHKIASLTLTAVGAACMLAAAVVDRLEQDKKTTAAYLVQDHADAVASPADDAAGDPAPAPPEA